MSDVAFNLTPTKNVTLLKTELVSSCNANCGGCGNLTEFAPVCGSDNHMYFNPCYAGCQEFQGVNGSKIFLNCSCVVGDSRQAIPGVCDMGCQLLSGFAIMLFLFILFTTMAGTSSIVATLRYVQPKHKSLALGIDSIIFR